MQRLLNRGLKQQHLLQLLYLQLNLAALLAQLNKRGEALEALRAVETRGLAGTIGSLRCLRGLMTPQARIAVAQAMLAGLKNQAALEGAARHEMLISMHWRAGNPHLDADKGVSPLPPLSLPRASPLRGGISGGVLGLLGEGAPAGADCVLAPQ
jgi:hypothetical protein